MKNIYYKIIFLFVLLFSQVSWSQLDNANWYFGEHAGLNFNSSTTVLTDGETNDINSETASVSDSDGNLLFYTDGHTVWNKNHDVMQGGNNTLNGGAPLIVPYPNHDNEYFIITNIRNGDNYDYYYSIIDVDENSGLGDVSQLNIDLGITATNKVLIAQHSDSSSYWFITPKIIEYGDEEFRSYKIDENGFSNIPIVSDINIQDSYSMFPFIHNLAISSDNSKIALQRFEPTIGGTKKNKSTSSDCDDSHLFIFDIDNSTGIINLSHCSDNPHYYNYYNSMEFSEDGNLLYLAGVVETPNYTNREILQIDTNNLTIIQTLGFGDSKDWISGPYLSRAIDGKIYVTQSTYREIVNSHYVTNYSLTYKLSVINNPNNYGTNCNFVVDQIDLGSNSAIKLPKLIPIHENSCVQNLTITQNVNSGQTDIQESSNIIIAKNTIFNRATAAYDAGNTVYLKPNFHAKYGSNFRAFIEGCHGTQNSKRVHNVSYNNTNLIAISKEELIKVFPNPTKNTITIEGSKEVDSWVVTNTYGKSYFNGNNTKSKIDMTNLPNGIYFLKAILTNGKVVTKTIIKN